MKWKINDEIWIGRECLGVRIWKKGLVQAISPNGIFVDVEIFGGQSETTNAGRDCFTSEEEARNWANEL